MSKKALNSLIRQIIVNYVLGKGTTSTLDTIDYVTGYMTDPRVTRERVSGNISAVCRYYNQLSYANGILS